MPGGANTPILKLYIIPGRTKLIRQFAVLKLFQNNSRGFTLGAVFMRSLRSIGDSSIVFNADSHSDGIFVLTQGLDSDWADEIARNNTKNFPKPFRSRNRLSCSVLNKRRVFSLSSPPSAQRNTQNHNHATMLQSIEGNGTWESSGFRRYRIIPQVSLSFYSTPALPSPSVPSLSHSLTSSLFICALFDSTANNRNDYFGRAL